MDDVGILGRLRPVTPMDLEQMLLWRNAPSVRANMYTKHEISMEEHTAWWERTSADPRREYYMYERGGAAYGVVGFTDIDRDNGHSAWAFYASTEAPRGTGSMMEWLALDYFFGDFGMRKLYCEVLGFNEPVIRLHKKYGFVEEGCFRAHYRHDNGYTDVHRLALFESDWRELRNRIFEVLRKRANAS